MSDYLFILENHLSVDQNRVVAEMQAAASKADLSLFLTGGAMRDMLGGYQIRDLDFTVEGNALKIAKALAAKPEIKLVSVDEHRRIAELVFPGGVTAQLSMSRQERYARTGARPQVTPAPIQDDLRRRDFTVNAIALSLNRASRGLLIDPLNGLAELGRRELRTISALAFYDDPIRLLRLVRLRIRLGFELEERTKAQYDNARAAGVARHISAHALYEELHHIAEEPNPAEIVRALEQDGLLALFSPALTGPKLNLPGLVKLDKARRMIPPDSGIAVSNWGPFLYVLTEKLGPKDEAELIHNTEMRKADVESWRTLPARTRKIENTLRSTKLKKPSQIYGVLSRVAGADIVFLLYHSSLRLVHDRIKNYLQKYVPLAQEITDAEVEATGVKPGTPKFAAVKADMIAARVDGRTKKPPPPPIEVPPGPVGRPRGRPPSSR